MRSLRVEFAIMAALLALDQLSKVWIRLEVPLHHSTSLIPHLIDLTHVENRGVSFSFLGDVNEGWRVPLLVGISLVAVILLGVYWLRHRHTLNAWGNSAFLMILPGAVGNLIDRMLFGTVTDFFHFRFYAYSFFVNNIADIYISVGVATYLIGMLGKPAPTGSEGEG